MQCSNIVPKEELDLRFLQPLEYKYMDGVYVYYLYQPPIIGNPQNPLNHPYNVQFCKKCGRKKDVFQCLNESEWKVCSYYKQF